MPIPYKHSKPATVIDPSCRVQLSRWARGPNSAPRVCMWSTSSSKPSPVPNPATILKTWCGESVRHLTFANPAKMRGATFTSKVRGLVPANLKRWELQTENRNHSATWKPANRYNRRINNWKSNRGVNQVYHTEVQKNSVGPPSPWTPFCTGFWNAVPMRLSSRFQPCLWLPPCFPLLPLSPWVWYLAFWFFCSWKWPLLLRINLPPPNLSFVLQKAIKLG